MNVYQKINEVRKEVSYIQKDKEVDTGRGKYRATTHDQVTGMVRQSLIKHGIVIVPSLVSGVLHEKKEGEKQHLYESVFNVSFVNAENPEDRVSINVPAHAMDNQDKATGKAMSYATKFAILKVFSLETGEDDESRYQSEDFDVAPHVEAILSADSIDSLKTVFQAAYKEATASGDKAAMKELMSVKDARKKALEAGK